MFAPISGYTCQTTLAYFLPEQAFRRLPRAGASPCTPRAHHFRLPHIFARAQSSQRTLFQAASNHPRQPEKQNRLVSCQAIFCGAV